MEIFAKNLRRRAQQLGLANTEVARRVGLSERRYAHYVSGRNEPDLAMLLKIAGVLQCNANELLSDAATQPPDSRMLLIDRLASTAQIMIDTDLEAAVAQAEAVVNLRRR